MQEQEEPKKRKTPSKDKATAPGVISAGACDKGTVPSSHPVEVSIEPLKVIDTSRPVLFVSGSPFGASPDLIKELAPHAGYIIALDSGGDKLKAAGLVPDLLLVDFDSITEDTLSHFKAEFVPLRGFDSYKNATDVELGIEELSSLGFRSVIATNVLGARSDHALGSLGALAGAALDRGMQILLRDNSEACFFVSSNAPDKMLQLEYEDETLVSATSFVAGQKSSIHPPCLPLRRPKHVSLISWGGQVTVSLKGTEWELDHHDLGPFSALGVSNKLVAPTLQLTVHKGNGTVLLLLTC